MALITKTFVDTTRSTPAWGTLGAHRGRTLVTSIYFPRGAGGPFPLIVFAHGFGSDPSAYAVLLRQWASAGYVVAAPLFPLTGAATRGGPDLADYVNQPGDMSFVISQVLAMSAKRSGELARLVDPARIGAAGHSLGGVTTLGLVANTCCRDPRVGAAVVMAGDPLEFGSGQPDYSGAPPILLVQGNADLTVPYVSSIDVFDSASAPKGLLTIEGGGHDSPVDPSGPAFSHVLRTTLDFFDVYLKHDAKQLSHLKADGDSESTHLIFAARRGQSVTIPVPTTEVSALYASVSPSQGLSDGQVVSVSWEGYEPGQQINVLECSTDPPTGPADCDLSSAKLFEEDPTGEGSLSFEVHSGAVGSGTCDATHNDCVIVVNQGGSSDPSDSAEAPIGFSS